MNQRRDRLFELLTAPAVSLSLFSRCLDLADRLREAIPALGVSPEERSVLGGYLFSEGPIVVDELARVIDRDPARFAGYPADLASGQLRAQGWRVLHLALQELADRALVLYQVEQARTTRQAVRILSDVRDRAARSFAGAEDRARARAAAVPAFFLRAWQRRKRGAR